MTEHAILVQADRQLRMSIRDHYHILSTDWKKGSIFFFVSVESCYKIRNHLSLSHEMMQTAIIEQVSRKKRVHWSFTARIYLGPWAITLVNTNNPITAWLAQSSHLAASSNLEMDVCSRPATYVFHFCVHH